MKPNAELTRTLADRAQNFTDTVPVFRIRSRSLEDIEQEAAECARRFVGRRSPESLRFSSLRKRDRTVLHLDEGASITAFHASGALAAKRGWNAFDERISDAPEEVDRDLLIRQGHEAVSKMELDRGAANEKLEFERLWQIKASGMTATGERGMTSVLRAVAAFRRVLEVCPYLGALPCSSSSPGMGRSMRGAVIGAPCTRMSWSTPRSWNRARQHRRSSASCRRGCPTTNSR